MRSTAAIAPAIVRHRAYDARREVKRRRVQTENIEYGQRKCMVRRGRAFFAPHGTPEHRVKVSRRQEVVRAVGASAGAAGSGAPVRQRGAAVARW